VDGKKLRGQPLKFEDRQQVQMGLQVVAGAQPGVFVGREGHAGGRGHSWSRAASPMYRAASGSRRKW